MAAELQRERDKVALLLKNQRELAAVVSHELRTPISVMRAYIENNLAEDAACRTPTAKIWKCCAARRSSCKIWSRTCSPSRKRMRAPPEPGVRWVSAGEIIAHVAASAGAVAWESKRIALSTQAPPDLPPVWADPRRLEQALGNLAQNAIRHTPAGGVIIVRAEPTAQGVEISVRDSGEGIAPADLPHIWERFYRGAQGGGSGRTGIGLALVQELVESMGGSVGVESQPGEGSRFWVRLNSEAAPSGSG
jgi:signal transduction histidine kinase